MTANHEPLIFFAILAAILHTIGLISAIRAVMTARTPQGSIAWAIALVSFPYFTLPLYWIFGRDRFSGYVIARRNRNLKVAALRQNQKRNHPTTLPQLDPGAVRAFEELAQMRFRTGNAARLLIDGEATFKAIFQSIDAAREYVLVQFYIVRDDELGRSLKDHLIAASRRGVRVYFLFDGIGSYTLPSSFCEEMISAKIDVHPFNATKSFHRFQINFRNHRKIVVVDGAVAFLGGHNVGNEYSGSGRSQGKLRDTHVEIRGPLALQAQVSFSEDWNWATDSQPLVQWSQEELPHPGQAGLILPTGPGDAVDSCGLFYLQAIESAKSRIWIATPYFVPDPAIVSALQLAAIRGIDVKIIVPDSNDNILVQLAIYSYLKDLLPYGVKMFRYQKCFSHQKVMLIDDALASVGSANFDMRSFRLNFEITFLSADMIFGKQVEKMLEEDLRHTSPFLLSDLTERSFFFRLSVQISRLLAPVL